mgnify:CR=1 FL=1
MKKILIQKGFTLLDTLQDNEKSTVVKLEKDGQLYIGKWLNLHRGGWPGKFRNEQRAYKVFSEQPPEFQIPERHPESTDEILIISYIDAEPLSHNRYIFTPLTPEKRKVCLDVCHKMTDWRLTGTHGLKPYDYPKRFEKLVSRGQIPETTAEKLANNFQNQTHGYTPQHGDLIPSNILLDENINPILIDWEYAHTYLPGFDLALLQITLMGDSLAQQNIDDLVHQKGIQAPFLLNKAIVLLREISIYKHLADKEDTHHQTLASLRTAWDELLKKL